MLSKHFLSWLVIALVISTTLSYGATGNIDVTTQHQQIEGFGAAGGWYENWLVSHPQANYLCDLLFGQLGLDIYRIRNTYDQGSDGASYMSDTGTIVGEALERNPNLKIMISSWSPPVYLKSNNNLVGGTLKEDANGFMYEAFAQWWADSIADTNDGWPSYDVEADYINMQNEPLVTVSHDSCKFYAYEYAGYAGYDDAFEAVYSEVNSRMGPNMPKMLAPETANIGAADWFIGNLIELSHVYGYAHHLYGGNPDDPDGYITNMENLKNFVSGYGNKPLFQTEFFKQIESPQTYTFTDAMNLAILIHNSLTVEEVVVYLYWELFWEEPKGLIGLENPWGQNPGYTINSVYYAFKHYSAFIHSGWQRVDATENSSDLRMSAYTSPDGNELSVIIINTGYSSVDISLSFTGFIVEEGGIYRTSETENCVAVGVFNSSSPLTIPARSITTLALSADESVTPPLPPMGFSAKTYNSKVFLDWDDNQETDVNGYNVYRTPNQGGVYGKINSSLVTDSNYIDQSVSNGETYYYVVTAVDIYNNESSYSLEESIVPYDGIFPRFYFCGFEDGWEDWTNLLSDDVNWFRDSGGTPTLRTGPDSGANGSTWYVYLESSDAGEGDVAILESPEIEQQDDRVLNFYYHMYGSSTGSLYVDVYDGSWHNGVWSLSGQQQSSSIAPYSEATVYLNNYTGPIKIRFRAVAVGGSTGDIAVDDIGVVCDRSYGDFTADAVVDDSDLDVLCGEWLVEDCNDPDGLDLDGNCMLNFYEYSLMAENWLK